MAAGEFPSIAVDPDRGVVCGVQVEWGTVPTALAAPVIRNRVLDADEHSVLVSLRTCRLLVEDGQRVIIEPRAGLSPRDLDFVLYGWAASLVMMFRGVNLLHASVVTDGGRTIAIASRSGAGKSTTTAGLVAQGWSLCVDDSAPIVNHAEEPWVVPYSRPTHLVAAVADRLAVPPSGRDPLPDRVKVAIGMPQDLRPRHLDAVVILAVRDSGAVSMTELVGSDALVELRRHLHVNHAALTPGRTAATLDWLRRLAELPVWLLTRPRGESTEAAVLDAVRVAVTARLSAPKLDSVGEQVDLQ